MFPQNTAAASAAVLIPIGCSNDAAADTLTKSSSASINAGDSSSSSNVNTINRLSCKRKFSAVLPASPPHTTSKKPSVAKELSNAEDYHRLMFNDRSDIVPVVADKLYFARLYDMPTPRESKVAFFYSTDELYTYKDFFDDFGPLSIGEVYRYCKEMERQLHLPINADRKLVHVGSAADSRLLANAAWLIGAYGIVVEKLSPQVVHERISASLNMQVFPPFRDAAAGTSTYDLSLLDYFKALDKAVRLGFFDHKTFDIAEYEHYEKVENGDCSWMTPNLLAFGGPSATPRLDTDGSSSHAPDANFSYFRKHNIKAIVGLNKPQYPATHVTDAGFQHVDLVYPEGTLSFKLVFLNFLRICKIVKGALAVHCEDGLASTGLFIGAYLMWHYRFTTAEAIAWLRIVRPGSIIGQQQHYLERACAWLWKDGDEYRLRQTAEAASASSNGVAPTDTITDEEKELRAKSSGLKTSVCDETATTTKSALSTPQHAPPSGRSHGKPVARVPEEPDESSILSTPQNIVQRRLEQRKKIVACTEDVSSATLQTTREDDAARRRQQILALESVWLAAKTAVDSAQLVRERAAKKLHDLREEVNKRKLALQQARQAPLSGGIAPSGYGIAARTPPDLLMSMFGTRHCQARTLVLELLHKFRHVPIGPIGYYLHIVQPDASSTIIDWLPIVCKALERMGGGLLSAYICATSQDRTVLDQIFNAVGMVGSAKPRIITGMFVNADYNKMQHCYPRARTFVPTADFPVMPKYFVLRELINYVEDAVVTQSVMRNGAHGFKNANEFRCYQEQTIMNCLMDYADTHTTVMCDRRSDAVMLVRDKYITGGPSDRPVTIISGQGRLYVDHGIYTCFAPTSAFYRPGVEDTMMHCTDPNALASGIDDNEGELAQQIIGSSTVQEKATISKLEDDVTDKEAAEKGAKRNVEKALKLLANVNGELWYRRHLYKWHDAV